MSSEKVGWRSSSKRGSNFPDICDESEAQDGYRSSETSFTGMNFANRSWADICDEDSQKTLEPEKDHASLLMNDDSTLGATSKDSKNDLREISSIQSKSEIRMFSAHSGLLKGAFMESETVKTEFRSDMKPVTKKRKECELILNEDSLSLSSHFDVIKMESPLKAQDTTPTKQIRCRSPVYCDESTVTSPYRLKRRVPLKESLTDENQAMDETLPSPSKISKRETVRDKAPKTPKTETPREKSSRGKTPKTPKTPRTPKESSDGNLKRKRVDSQPNTPQTPGSSGKLRLEIEDDPDVLFRRQKQIDYGKNTQAYERYLELVPKELRTKDHPKTPPKNLKYSRRAWDGLVRTWRKRLHYWGSPNEDGTMPEMSDDSSMSETSSCDESMSTTDSLPTTPMQEWKRRVRTRRESESSDCSSALMEDDCKPLPAEDIRV